MNDLVMSSDCRFTVSHGNEECSQLQILCSPKEVIFGEECANL